MMIRLLKSLIIACLLLFAFLRVEAQSHPRILVNNDDKQTVLSKIEYQAWAKELYGKMLEKIEPIAERLTRQPDWILSRYQMYRIPGKHYTDFYTDRGGAILRQDGRRIKVENLSHPEFTMSVISLNPPPLYLDTIKEGLKRLEIRIPAWTIDDENLSMRVRLAGD